MRHLHETEDAYVISEKLFLLQQSQPLSSDAPQPMNQADIIYADICASNINVVANIIGGVIKPASIASACCNLLAIAR